MVQKYQNEIPPTFYYGISTKTNEKDLKIPNLQPRDWGQPYWMTRYVCGQSPIDFENILEETYLPISTYIYISFLPKQTLFQRCS